jgi:hypothetical protein
MLSPKYCLARCHSVLRGVYDLKASTKTPHKKFRHIRKIVTLLGREVRVS